MTKHFIAKIWFFDTEEYQTTHTIAHALDKKTEEIIREREGLWDEKIKVKEVELLEYEKED